MIINDLDYHPSEEDSVGVGIGVLFMWLWVHTTVSAAKPLGDQ